MNYKNPKECAKDFIEYEVKRGDSLESIMAGHGGCAGRGYSANIGGYAVLDHGSDNKDDWKSIKIKRDEIVITEFNGKECFEKFKLSKLFDEIKSGRVQQDLF